MSGSDPLPRVTLYSRPGCHLCDVAREAILATRSDGAQFELEEIDIESDDELHAAYLERIPVVAVEGELVSELALDADALRSRLDTVRG
jgi:glutaredoxin